jgi:hypothetical protein
MCQAFSHAQQLCLNNNFHPMLSAVEQMGTKKFHNSNNNNNVDNGDGR